MGPKAQFRAGEFFDPRNELIADAFGAMRWSDDDLGAGTFYLIG
jgi:hypothetical protein